MKEAKNKKHMLKVKFPVDSFEKTIKHRAKFKKGQPSFNKHMNYNDPTAVLEMSAPMCNKH